jgi:hypothetical protein
MTRPTCPDDRAWRALLAEAGGGADELVRHLETCAGCRRTLEVLAAEPAVWEDAQGLEDAARGEAALRQVVERLKGDDLPPGDEDLSFLRPTAKPGLLGLLGRYEVQEEIGRGGMGVVLKALDPDLNRPVAIKVLSPWLASSATARRRFVREAQAAAAVCHDHVVTVHGVHEDGLPYLVMQYVAGESLQARLDRDGPLEVEEVVRIGMQTASGLAAAHAQGLIHRDIKPANLLLEDGLAKVKITDFGLARMADDVRLTQSGVVAGTPEYMAPEQARGEEVDHRADLFSLGSVLYACCTGTPPFRGSTAVAVLRRVSDEEPIPVRSLHPEVPAWLESVVMRLLAKDPAARFPSAAGVAGLLEGYLAHLRQPATIAAPKLPAFPGGLVPPKGARAGLVPTLRHPLLWVALALVAAVGLGVGLVGLPPVGGVGVNLAADEPDVPVRRLRGHTGPVHNVQFTPDGRRLVSGSGWPQSDQTVRVWDLDSAQERGRIKTPGGIHSLEIAPDGRWALVGLNTGQVAHLDLETPRLVRTLKVHTAAVGCVLLAADGKRVLSTSDEGTARLWNLADGKEVGRFPVHSKQARGAALLPDGRGFITGDSAGMLQLWDIPTGREVKQIPMGGPWMIDAIRLSPDGRQVLVSGVPGVRLYDLETGEEVRHFQEETEEATQADLSPDGRWLLTGGFDGKVRLWDFATGQLLRVLGSHDGFVFSVAFAPDGRVAASAGGGENNGGNFVRGSDHDIRLWDLTALRARPAASPVPGQKGWLRAVGVCALATALCILAACFYLRQSRRDRPAGASLVPSPEPPGPDGGTDQQAQPATATSAIALGCPGCGKNLKVRAELGGRKVKCPQCGQVVLVP